MNKTYLDKTRIGTLFIGLSLAAINSAQADTWSGGTGKFEDPTAWGLGTVPASSAQQSFQLNDDGSHCTADAATWAYLSDPDGDPLTDDDLLNSSTVYRGVNRALFGQTQSGTQTVSFTLDIGDANMFQLTSQGTHIIGARQNTTTTLNIISGTMETGKITTLGNNATNCTATLNLSGGEFRVGRDQFVMGGNTATSLVNMTGGTLKTRTGLEVRENATFQVQGSAPVEIGIGSHASGDGFAIIDGTLKPMIDAGGVTKIFVDDTGGTGTYATINSGALLDVSFLGIPDTVGTWTVLEVENGDITDGGLAFAGTVDTSPLAWTFNVDNSGPNGLLTVSWGLPPIGPVVYWDGTADNNWDTTTVNWIADDEITPTTYADAAQATFDQFRTNDGTVNLTTSLSPYSITVDNDPDGSAKPYTFTGTGSITGFTGITKSGSGSLALNNTGGSDFTGLVDLQEGSITVGDATALGASSGDVLMAAGTTLDLGALSVSKGTVTVVGGTLTNGTLTNSTVAVTDAATIDAVLAGEATTLTKSGAGTLNLDGNNTFAGQTTISAGTVILGDANALGSGTLAPLSVVDVTKTTGSPVVTVTPGTEITIGSHITGTGIPAGTVVGAYDSALGEITLSANATTTSTDSATLSGIGAVLDSGSNIVTVAPGTPIQVNMQVSGIGIVEATRVTAYNSGTGEVTLLANPTVTSSEVLTFTGSTNLSGGTSTLDLNGQTTSELLIGFATNSKIINSDLVTPGVITQEIRQVGTPTFDGPGDITIGNIKRTNGVTRRIIKNGTGILTLAGDSNNDRHGLTVNEGDVILAKTDGDAVSRFELIMNNAASTVSLTVSSDQIGNQTDGFGNHQINAGTLDLNGFDEGLGALATTNGTETDGVVTNSNGVTTSTLTLLGSFYDPDGNDPLPAADQPALFPGTISGNLNLVKEGGFTQTLSGTVSHTGNTTITAGTLELAAATTVLDDSSDVFITDGALNLSNGLTEVIDELWIDGIQQASGTYGATGSGAGTIDDTHFAGTGVLSVTTDPPTPTDPYLAWAGGAAFDADTNNDGVDNGLAWMLGAADVNEDALPLLPTSVESGGALVISFTIVDPIAPNQLFVEYSTDLTGAWTPVEVPAATGTVGAIDFMITDNGGSLDVVATINAGSGSILFGRLSAVEAGP